VFALKRLSTACALVLGLTVFVGPAAAQETGFTAEQEERISELVRKHILDNPEIIAEAITLLQARQEAQRQERQQETLANLLEDLRNPPEGTVIGEPDGSVTVVEFFDYNCGYCKSMFTTVMNVIEEHGDVRLALIEFPILGPNSVVAAKAALASREQDLYGPFHQALMNHRGSLNESTVMSLARGVGINVTKLEADMKDPELDQIIERNRGLAQQLEINGTPAFIVGTELVPGAVSEEQFKQLLADAEAS
jgi:protein-disulfide isomerase